MKFYTSVFVLLLAIIFIAEYLLYRYENKFKPPLKYARMLPGVVFALGFIFIKVSLPFVNDYRFNFFVQWYNWVFLLLYIPHFMYAFWVYYSFKNKNQQRLSKGILLTCISMFVFVLLTSTFITPYKPKINTLEVYIKHLPASFDNYNLIQISDAHLGARLYDKAYFEHITTLINDRNPDLIVFTGDMINNFAEEMIGFDSIFNALQAQDGKFAVLGNHDYGDYSNWPDTISKVQNLKKIKDGFRKFGFQLLLNQHVHINRNNDSIALIGVENYHVKQHQNYANYTKAIEGISATSISLLLNHNPLYWPILDSSTVKPALTLSGHTHAGQFGLTFGNKVYSPVGIIYPQYNGLYVSDGYQLYVNRGIGFIGLPFIVGLKPEITEIILKRAL